MYADPGREATATDQTGLRACNYRVWGVPELVEQLESEKAPKAEVLAMKDYSVIVVSQSEKLDRMSRAAVEKLGAKLRSGRAVKAEAKRFAAKIAARPSILHVDLFDVAGLADVASDRPGEREPLVLHEGKFVPVTHTYLMVAGEYHVVANDNLDASRNEITAESARRIAEGIFLGDAMMAAIDAADPDCTLSGMSSYSATCTVTLNGDDNGTIASKLPAWITVGEEGRESAVT